MNTRVFFYFIKVICSLLLFLYLTSKNNSQALNVIYSKNNESLLLMEWELAILSLCVPMSFLCNHYDHLSFIRQVVVIDKSCTLSQLGTLINEMTRQKEEVSRFHPPSETHKNAGIETQSCCHFPTDY